MILPSVELASLYEDKYSDFVKEAKFRVGSQDAEDVVQAAFTTMWAERESYNVVSEEFLTWARRHLNRAIKVCQRDKRLQGMCTSTEDEGFVEPYYSLDTNLPLIRDAYLREFSKQTTEVQEFLHLHIDKEYTASEIANMKCVGLDYVRYNIRKVKEAIVRATSHKIV